MNWSSGIRQFHRWMAWAFTAGFVINLIVIFGIGQANPAFWVYLLVLIPLFLLLPTGLYMLLRPHFRARGRDRAELLQP